MFILLNFHPGIIRLKSVSEISAGQLLLTAADGTIASEEGEVCMGNMTAAGYFADLSASRDGLLSQTDLISNLIYL